MKIIIYSLAIFLISLILLFLRYRLVNSKIIKGESEVKYKVIEIGQRDFLRYSFESILLNRRRVFLKSKLNDIEWLYLDKKDFNKLNPENLIKMKNKGYTYKFKFEIKRLIFGGYGSAKIISFERVNHNPEVNKS